MWIDRPSELNVAAGRLPRTLAAALDPQWLTWALSVHTGGTPITHVETVEVIRTVATKVRFKVTFGDRTEAYCLKGFLDMDIAGAGVAAIREADFYTQIAPRLRVRIPSCVVTIVERESLLGIVIMRDLIAEGARFCTALEAFTADQAARSLEQLALLHTERSALTDIPWLGHQVMQFAKGNYIPAPKLQEMLDGERGKGLPASTRDANALITALGKLAALDAEGPHVLVHGDAHAGNIFETTQGPGLIDWQIVQRGGWALDVAYHICAVLDVPLAEKEERTLLRHYLGLMRNHGADMPDDETAWLHYRRALVYGYYLWAITRRVEPAITNVFVNRLGNAVTRHESFKLLGG